MTGNIAQRIAIDGPVGAGKTTVGREVAKRLGYGFLDTGLMYRALTRAALDRGVAFDDEAAMVELARDPRIAVKFDEAGEARVEIDGVDATARLRTPKVDQGVPVVAAIAGGRRVLVARQKEIAAEAPIVMVGRDIGTVVLVEADLKVFLTASVEERARRRHFELKHAGTAIGYEAVLESLKRRDEMDTDRAASPLRPADDSRLVDTDGLNLEQVVEKVFKLVEAAG